MSHYYLADSRGDGSDADPFRPVGADDHPSWEVLYLGTPRLGTGRGVLVVPARLDRPGMDYLGQDSLAEAPPVRLRTGLETRFGLTLASASLRDIIAELVFARFTTPRAIDGRLKIMLAGIPLYDVPVLRGGSSALDTFNRVDNAALGDSSDGQFTWVDDQNTWRITSNQALCSGGPAMDRAPFSLASEDHYAEANIITSVAAGPGPCVRKAASSTLTFYHARAGSLGASATLAIFEFTTGSATQLASTTTAVNSGDTVRVQMSGSDYTVQVNGVTRIGPTTDSTPITGNVQTGIRAASTNDVVDAFACADLSATWGPLIALRNNRLMGVGLFA